jgi:hypothetical protein
MANEQETETFTLRNASKVFPDKFTRIVWDDLVSIASKNKRFLTKEEYEYLISMAWGNVEIIIERDNRKIKIIPFD